MGYTVFYTPMGDKVSFIDIKSELNESELYEFVEMGGFDRIQCQFVPSAASLKLLNTYYSKFPQTGFRIYGGISSEFMSLAFLSELPSIRKLSIDFNGSVETTEMIGQLRELESLEISVGSVDKFNFIKNLPDTIKKFECETESKNLDLSLLCGLSCLKQLKISGYKKNIESLAELPLLEDLMLKGITLDRLDFINNIPKLKILKIHWGNTSDFSALYGNSQIKGLQLFRISKLMDLTLLAQLPSLHVVELSQLRHIESLPDLSGNTNLHHILLDDLKSLLDLSVLEHIKNLESASFSCCPPAFESENILPVLRNPAIMQCSFYTRSQKKNERIAQLIFESGKKNTSNVSLVRDFLFHIR